MPPHNYVNALEIMIQIGRSRTAYCKAESTTAICISAYVIAGLINKSRPVII